MHYYALLPCYAYAIARVARARSPATRLRIAAIGLAALAVAGLAFSFELTRRESLFWFVSLPVFLHWFAAGMALALISSATSRWSDPGSAGAAAEGPRVESGKERPRTGTFLAIGDLLPSGNRRAREHRESGFARNVPSNPR
jgi:hypothetical protein